MLQVSCPQCAHTNSIDNSLAGDSCRCVNCHLLFRPSDNVFTSANSQKSEKSTRMNPSHRRSWNLPSHLVLRALAGLLVVSLVLTCISNSIKIKALQNRLDELAHQNATNSIQTADIGNMLAKADLRHATEDPARDRTVDASLALLDLNNRLQQADAKIAAGIQVREVMAKQIGNINELLELYLQKINRLEAKLQR